MEKIIITIKENEGRNVIAYVTSVARSGMSRRIKFGMCANNTYIPLTGYISEKLGIKYHDNGLLIHGCGMDMVFKTLADFYKEVFPEIDGKTRSEWAGHYRIF